MLVLNRKIGERIVVPHSELVITVLAIEGKTVRLDVSSQSEADVHRDEEWRQPGQKEEDSRSVQSEADRFRTLLQQSDVS